MSVLPKYNVAQYGYFSSFLPLLSLHFPPTGQHGLRIFSRISYVTFFLKKKNTRIF